MGQGDQHAVDVVQDCLVVGGRAAAGDLVRHGLSAPRFDVHGDRDTYTILELSEALSVAGAHAAAADESQAGSGHRGSSGRGGMVEAGRLSVGRCGGASGCVGGAVWDARCGGFVRVRVFSKKLLRCGGAVFG